MSNNELNKSLTQLNFLARIFTKYALGHVRYADNALSKINELHNKGFVVNTTRTKGIIWYLALNVALANANLPIIKYVAGLVIRYVKPFYKIFTSQSSNKFINCVISGVPTQLFLTSRKKNSSAEYIELISCLIQIQRITQKPIFLLPHILIYKNNKHPLPKKPTDLLQGTWEPGFFRAFFRILFSKNVLWHVGEEIDIKAFLHQFHNLSNEALAKKIRFKLLKSISQMEHTLFGPTLKSHARIKTAFLRDKDLQKFITKSAVQTKASEQKIKKKAAQIYDDLAAKFDMDFLRIFDRILRLIWDRIYEGLAWNESDIQNIRNSAHHGPLIFIPSHKSHVDYLVLSQVLYFEGLMPPHIAAGSNLAFFPMGFIFRRCGAYFIKRRFSSDQLYIQVVKTYIKHLLKEGFSQEFFIEGGRSRTGKLLPPKLGLLSIIVEVLNKNNLNAVFVPTSISYEKLIESASFHNELSGQEKQQESAKDLVKSASFLRKEHGRVFVTFDEPIIFNDFRQKSKINATINDADINQKHLVSLLAQEIMHGISRSLVITKTALCATALFGARKRAMSRFLIKYYCKKIMQRIKINEPKANFSEKLLNQFSIQIDKSLDDMAKDQLIIEEVIGKTSYFKINEKSALNLDFYKNNIINHFIPDAILANSICSLHRGPKGITLEVISKHAYKLANIFKNEFVMLNDNVLSDSIIKSIDFATSKGILEKKGHLYILSNDKAKMAQFIFAVQIIANFIDAYFVCFNKLSFIVEKVTNQKGLIIKLLEQIKAAFITGIIQCPESANKEIVNNAIDFATKVGALHFKAGKPHFIPTKDFLEAKNLLQNIHLNRNYF
jgi:glycerol-3-phosphate O-acyltransferase